MATISDADDLITIRDVLDLVPQVKGAKKITTGMVYQWVRGGISGVEPLETIRFGSRVYTTREALDRFFDRSRQARDGLRIKKPDPATLDTVGE